jgi:fluoroacetyl-CoA thioesterase
VRHEHTLTAHHHHLPPIFTTAEMLRMMETAAMFALQPYCEPGEISVGTDVQVTHTRPVGINAAVRATAEVESVDGRFYRFRVAVYEGKDEIGSGTLSRAIVNVDDYFKKYDIPKP